MKQITKRMWNISGKEIERGQAVVLGRDVMDSWLSAKWYMFKWRMKCLVGIHDCEVGPLLALICKRCKKLVRA